MCFSASIVLFPTGLRLELFLTNVVSYHVLTFVKSDPVAAILLLSGFLSGKESSVKSKSVVVGEPDCQLDRESKWFNSFI